MIQSTKADKKAAAQSRYDAHVAEQDALIEAIYVEREAAKAQLEEELFKIDKQTELEEELSNIDKQAETKMSYTLKLQLKMIKWHSARDSRLECLRFCSCGHVLGMQYHKWPEPRRSRMYTTCRRCFREQWSYDKRVQYARLKYGRNFVEPTS